MQIPANPATGFVTLIIIIGICFLCTKLPRGAGGSRTSGMSPEDKRLRRRFESATPFHMPMYESMSESRQDTAARFSEPEARQVPGVLASLRRVPPRSARRATPPTTTATRDGKVEALRGGEFIGNRMRFKVKVWNKSRYTITDITVHLISYPREALELVEDDDDIFFPKIEPQGFRSPHFDFLPTQDCVRGEIVAGVSYVDSVGRAYTLSTRPFVIRAVCDLMQPEMVSAEEFELRLARLEQGEISVKVEEWTPEEMHEKALRVLADANFHEVESIFDEKDGIIFAKVTGWARGKYTQKSLGVQVHITGAPGQRGATCRIIMSGEDQAMILPAIDDLKERLSVWMCPMCGGKLSLASVEELKKGQVVKCNFCEASIGR